VRLHFVLEWRTRRGSRRGVLNLIYLAGEERKLLDDRVANRIRHLRDMEFEPCSLPCGPLRKPSPPPIQEPPNPPEDSKGRTLHDSFFNRECEALLKSAQDRFEANQEIRGP
jgi:hypothetical protein